MNKFFYPILFSVIGGFSTILGGYIAVKLNLQDERKLHKALAFSGGVMVSISIVSLMLDSLKMFFKYFSVNFSFLMFFLSLSFGFCLSRFIEFLISFDFSKSKVIKQKTSVKTGLVIMAALVVHNFPEGIITFISSLNDLKAGFFVTIAIILHNIPEGIAVASPIYFGTKNKRKALFYCFLSGISEPVGALIAALFLKDAFNFQFLSIILAVVAGLMIDVGFFKLAYQSYKKIGFDKMFFYFCLGFLFIFLIVHFIA